jgi:uncharacterized protein YecT (DUF1311 family)
MFLLLSAFAAAPACAQPAAQPRQADTCAASANEAALLACRTKATAAQMRSIDQANARLIKRAADEPALQAALRASHQAWLRHRDAECRVETWESSSGSAAATHLLYCQQMRNAARLADLGARISAP